MPYATMVEMQGEEYVIVLNGISPHSYLSAKQIWNAAHGIPTESTMFLDFCANQWLQVKPLYNTARQDGMPEVFSVVYSYYRDMTIVGAQAELERIRGRWPISNLMAVLTVMHLRGLRIAASTDYGPEPLVHDTEEPYFRQMPQTLEESGTESENAPHHE